MDATYESEFPITKKYSYLNNAAMSPLPRRVVSAVNEFQNESASIGDLAWDGCISLLKETRKLVAEFIKASPEEIAFVKNTSEGISFVANCLDWKPGDRVITTDSEFPSNLYPWTRLKEKGVEVTVVGHSSDGSISIDQRKYC